MTPLARLTRAQRQAAFDAQGGVCKLCKLAMHPKSFHVDHIVPRELGGTNRPDNLQALHRDCHGQKTPGDVKAIASSKRQAAKQARHDRAMATGTRAPNAKERARARMRQNRIEPIAPRQDP